MQVCVFVLAIFEVFLKLITEGLKENKNLERMSLASNRLTAIGVKAIAEAITSHPTLVLFDFGFTKATTTVGEVYILIKLNHIQFF